MPLRIHTRVSAINDEDSFELLLDIAFFVLPKLPHMFSEEEYLATIESFCTEIQAKTILQQLLNRGDIQTVPDGYMKIK
jgi:hypothetical protein